MGSDSEGEKSVQREKERKKILALAPIAKPLAGKKLSKRTLKLVKKGTLSLACWFCRCFYFKTEHVSMNEVLQ